MSFCGIGFLSMGFKPLKNQPLTMLYNPNPRVRGQQEEVGMAKTLCDFLFFVKSPDPEMGGAYVAMFKNGDKLEPIQAEPLLPNPLPRDFVDEKIDPIVHFLRKTGFIVGLPFIIAGISTIRSGIKGLKKEFKKKK